MTKFEEEFKRPANGPLTELNNNMQEVFSQYRKMRQYADYLECNSKKKDEEFQELFDKYSNLNDHYEKEVIRSSKLESQIIGLKSQLQQQALPVVPECVAEELKRLESTSMTTIGRIRFWTGDTVYDLDDEVAEWVGDNEETILRAMLYGYTVEKPQLFRLKLKNATISNYYLWLNQATGKVFVDKKFLDWTNHDNVKNIFTEQEIAKISDGAFVNNEAFELVPVEV